MTSSDWQMQNIQEYNNSPMISPDRNNFRRQRKSMNLGLQESLFNRRKGSAISLFSSEFKPKEGRDPSQNLFQTYQRPQITRTVHEVIPNTGIGEVPGAVMGMSPSDKSFLRTIVYSCSNLTNMFDKDGQQSPSRKDSKVKSVSRISKNRIQEISQFLQKNDIQRRNYYNNVKGNISVYFQERKNGLLSLQKRIQKNRKKMMKKANKASFGRLDGY